MLSLFKVIRVHIHEHMPRLSLAIKFIKIFLVIAIILISFLKIIDLYYNYFDLFSREHKHSTQVLTQAQNPPSYGAGIHAVLSSSNSQFDPNSSQIAINGYGNYQSQLKSNSYPILTISDDSPVEAFNAASIVLLTSALIAVAWIQLEKIKEVGRADFLMRIDEKYGSATILKARSLILDIKAKHITSQPHFSHDYLIKMIGKDIKNMYKQKMSHSTAKLKHSKKDSNISNITDEMRLLNFLNYLETIAFFANRHEIHYREVHELLGGPITYYYKIFTPLIHYLREIEDDDPSEPYLYCELDKLVKNINIHNKN